ncbi:aspartate aminotransferase family protein [Paenibacillus sp. N1-5-1-14]|uniref:aspartate aminotransferase family protein n=1 Tax=Paenibacillus radicibacter TaxID=2972488 RepID=UPI002158B20E|nr:aspartate aminotransferase family protein [Paenibacillus radicibacter]MCR8641052.1 aspartate aminotransferase family protein [Paenibacillus radicibacter]
MTEHVEKKSEIRELAVKHLSPVMTRITDLVVTKAQGAKFWTEDGVEYIDFVSGVAVNAVGHAHPAVVKAIHEQSSNMIHLGLNYGYYESAVRLAQKLAAITPGNLDTVFFSNSGAEAIDGAIKLARAVTKRPNIIAFEGSFHGRTLGATSLTASSSKYRKYYEPLVGGVYHVPYPYQRQLPCQSEEDTTEYCLNRLTKLFELIVDPTQVAAIIIEPVMGEGGYVPAPAAFLQQLRKIADDNGILLIFDEVQTGFGRTGTMFASEHAGVVPDVLVLAKALASGLPLGAIVANRDLHDKWQTGTHGSTFGGNPVACAAALASIQVIEQEGLVERSERVGNQIVERLKLELGDLPSVAEIRGVGMMIGIEFQDEQVKPGTAIVSRIREEALKQQLLVTSCGVYGQTIRLMLPLNIDDNVLDQGLTILKQSIFNAIK